jgi:hypothetical protein
MKLITLACFCLLFSAAFLQTAHAQMATYLASKSSTHEQFKELASSEGLHRLLRDKLSDSETSQG